MFFPTLSYQTSRCLAASVLPLLLIACDSDKTSLLDLESLFPQDVITATNPTLPPAPGSEVVDIDQSSDLEEPGSPQTEIDQSDDDPMPTPVRPITQTNGISAELLVLTRGDLLFESRFRDTDEPIFDLFQLSEDSYDFNAVSNFGTLTNIDGSTISVCTHLTSSGQYMCLRSFDLAIENRVWHLFTMDTATTGTGVFEFCTAEDTQDACSQKLFDNPDGTSIVTISAPTTVASLPETSPYYAYGNQATVNQATTRSVFNEHYRETMKSLIDTTKAFRN